MALRYIMGRAGSGKSRQVLNEIKFCLEDGCEQPLILLVPEQYTLQAERDLLEKLKLPGMIQVEVLSFTRMASRVFNEVGGLTRALINEQGKNMVLRRVINQKLSGLTIYQQAARQEGFVAQCSQMMAELKQYDISTQTLRDRLEQMEADSMVSQKVSDLTLIYEGFNDYLQGRYLDMEDYINLFIDKLQRSQYFRGATLWIDNFTTFSPQSLRIIEELMLLAGDLTICLTRDDASRPADQELFALSDAVFRKFHVMAAKRGIAEEKIVIDAGDQLIVKSPELKLLERELYAYPGELWPGVISHIHLFAAANTYSEVENLAACLVGLARDEGWRWKDMAVVCQDLPGYGPNIKRVFSEYQIPLFMDEKRDIIDHPIIQFILASLDIVQRGYRYEDISRCCKTGFTLLAPTEYEELENYILRYGIHGYRMKDDFAAGEPERHELLNQWRKTLVEPLVALEKKLAAAQDFAGITQALYDYMLALGLAERLADEIEIMQGQGCYERVSENTQIWNIVLETLDQLYAILGDQAAGVKEYRQVLETGFLSFELGLIPTTVDQVLVGSIQRSKSQDVRAVFVLGLNDGILPSGSNAETLLSAEEKAYLESLGLEIGMSRAMMVLQENYLIYNAFSKPSEALWLSYALADSDGRALRPSILVNRLRYIFPNLTPASDLIEDREMQLKMVCTPGSTLKYLVRNLRSEMEGRPLDGFWWDVYHWYEAVPDWKNKRDFIAQGFLHRNQVQDLGPAQAGKLYPHPFRSNVSRLEQYVNCPFAHFIRYGMRPAERKTYEVSAPDIGELFHGALQGLATKIDEQGLSWQCLERGQCDSLMDQVMEAIVPLHADGVFNSTHRYRYLVNRLKRVGRRSAWILAQHIKAGNFEPLGYELRFGSGGALPAVQVLLASGETLFLEGRIDRVDIYDTEDASYVRVIDYKTGGKTFSMSDAYYGLSLQLLVYLQALLARNSLIQRDIIKPAGIFYFKIDDPAVKDDDAVLAEVEQQIARKLKMDGMVLKDVTIVRAMDASLEKNSDIIPVGLKRDGDFAQYSSVLDEGEFASLLKHVETLLRQIAGEIIKGRVKIEPVMIDDRKACDYCAYHAVCQFDQLFEDNRFRRLGNLKPNEVLQRMANSSEMEVDE